MDSIYILGSNPDRDIRNFGWCDASKEYLGNFLSINPRSVFRLMDKLIKKGFLEKIAGTRRTRATAKWYNTVYLINGEGEELTIQDMVEKMPIVKTMTKCHTKYDKVSYPTMT